MTQTKRELARKGGIYALGEGILGLSQVATAVILTRALDRTTFAEISLIILIYSSAIGIGGFNLHQSVFYFLGRLTHSHQKRFVIQTSKILTLIAVVTAAALMLFSLVGPAWGFQLEGRMERLVLVVLLELPTLPMANLLLARGRASHAALVNILSGCGRMAAIVVPLVLGMDLNSSLNGLVLYGLLRLLAYLVVVSWLFPQPASKPDWPLAKAQIIYTLPLGFAMLTGMLNRQIDKYLVAAFLSPEEFAIYVVGAQEVPLVTVIPYAVGAVLMAPFVKGYLKGETAWLLDLWRSAVSKVSMLVIPLTVLAILVADQLVVVLFSQEYAESALPFRIYTLILFHRVAEYGLILRAAGETRALWIASLILLLGNVILSVPLVILLGMPGPALATLLANIPAWLYVLNRIGRVLEVGLREVFPWRWYGKVLATAILAALPVVVLMLRVSWSTHLLLSCSIVLYLFFYFALMQLFGLSSWRELLGLLRRDKTLVA